MQVKHRIVKGDIIQQITPNSSSLITDSLTQHSLQDGVDYRDLRLDDYGKEVTVHQRDYTPNTLKERPQSETVSLFSKVSKIDSNQKGIHYILIIYRSLHTER
jgi:hypothetical protein